MASKSAARRAWRVARGKIDPRCDYCGGVTSEHLPENHPQRATVEDIVPLSKGGRNNRSNWALACSGCNQLKGNDQINPGSMSAGAVTRCRTRKGVSRMFENWEKARRARLASLPFTLYTPIPGVPDEAFR